MTLLPFVLRSMQRHALIRLAMFLAFSISPFHAWKPAVGQAIPYVVPGTLTQASSSSHDCFTQHLCGDNGPLSQASFTQPDEMAFDSRGNLYIVDATDARVRKVTKGTGPLTEGIVTSFAGQPGSTCASPTSACGDGSLATDPSVLLNGPSSIAFNTADDLFIADYDDNRLRRVDHSTGIITTYAGNGSDGFSNPSSIDGLPATQVGVRPWAVAAAPDGTVYIIDRQGNGRILAIDPTTQHIRTYGGSIDAPAAIAVAPNGDLYVLSSFPDNLIHKIANGTGITTIVAGGGSNSPYGTIQKATDTNFNRLSDVRILPSGDLLVVDSFEGQVFRVEMSTGLLYPIAGCSTLVNCGQNTAAVTNVRISPTSIVADPQGNIFFISDAAEMPISEVQNLPATINFADTALNTRSSDSPQTVYLMNFGAQPLALAAGTSGVPSTFNPLLTVTTTGAENSFALDSNSKVADGVTTACPSPTSSPSALAAGATCGFDLAFRPTATGTITGDLTIRYDGANPVAPQQTIPLIGKTATSTASATIVAQSTTYGTASVTLQGSITYSGSAAPSGTATFTVNGGTAIAATCTGAAPLICTAAYNPSTLTVGSYPISFHVTAGSNYAAIDANGMLAVNKANATVTLGSLSATYDGNPHAASVITAPSGLGVSITYNGAATAPSAMGSYAVVATVAESNYVGSATGTLIISALTTPSITFAIPPHAFGDTDFNIAAASSSSGALAYRIVSGAATLSGSTVHLTGAGIVTVEASQAAAGNYSAATKITTFNVAKATPSINWPAPAPVAYGTLIGPAQLNATATGIGGVSVPGNFTYTPAAGNVAVQTPAETLRVVFTPTDVTDYNTATASVSLTNAPAALDVTANDATRMYGNPNPAFGGTITGQQNGDTFAESFSTSATLNSDAGTYAILPTAVGANLGHYTQRIHAGTLTITRGLVQVNAVSSIASPLAGQNVMLTATIVSSTIGTPTGSVQFLDNGTPIGTATLHAAQAALTTSFTNSGTHVLTLAYSGDSNFQPATAAIQTFTIASQDFTLTLLSSPSSDLHVGDSGIYQIRVSPVSGQTFSADVHMSYSADLPPYAGGQLSVALINAGAGSTDLTFSVITRKLAMNETITMITVAMLLPLGLIRRRKTLRMVSLIAIAVATLITSSALSGCGAGYFARTIPVVIKAESSGITHTVTIRANIEGTPQ